MTLAERIAAEIRAHGPIPFSRFMERALYEPGLGYYAASAARTGRDGDFFTASDVGPAFGACLARQLGEMDRLLGRPDPFTLLEFGPGRGWLARDLLDALSARDPDLRARLALVLVETSAAMREEASRRVPEARVIAPAAVPAGRAGAVLAMELFDALPVHRLRRIGGRIQELFVALDAAGTLCESPGEPLPEAAGMAERYGAAPGEGDEAEVCPSALAALDGMERCLERGFLLIVDYGDRAPQLYAESRSRGTLLAYHRHATSEAVLDRVGEQDLTAHVNFSALEDRARERGLLPLCLTTQDRFLIANGILEEFEDEDPARWRQPDRVRRRLQAMQLIHPEGMGRAFKVLVLAKGIEPAPVLAGLRDPLRG